MKLTKIELMKLIYWLMLSASFIFAKITAAIDGVYTYKEEVIVFLFIVGFILFLVLDFKYISMKKLTS